MPVETEGTEQEVTPAAAEASGEVESGAEGEESLGAPAERAEATAVKDRAALETSVASLLGKAFDNTDEEPEAEADGEAEVVDEDAETEDETPSDEEVEDEGTEAEEAAAPVAKVIKPDPNAPTLPAAHIRTLKAYEWTDEEIAQNLKVLGSKFVETAAKLHKNRNDETLKWAEAGRQHRQQQAAAAAAQRIASPQQDTSAVLPLLDVKKLKEQFGDDKLIDLLVGPVNAQTERLNALLPKLEQVQNQSVTNQQDIVIRQIEGFFGGKELEPYKEIYGDTTNDAGRQAFIANPTTRQNRDKVLEMADALMAGAGLQGRSLTLSEALTQAHDSLSSGYKVKAVRTTLTKNLRQRQRAITQKPSGRAPNNPTGVNGTKSALEKKVGGLLTKAFA